ncbi:MAG: septum formation initiator family protein [Gammaproteobacteria bacterium]|nr:septum formation initiator family protein [Gammaproteobacteria bacterium]
MTELLATLAGLISSLGNVQSLGAAKEHIALLQTKVGLLKDEFAKLEKENTKLKKRVAELEQQLSTSAESEEYVEERGALFKRRPGGGYHNAVYCPRCHSSTSPFPPGAEFNCQCGWASSFTEGELQSVISSLHD